MRMTAALWLALGLAGYVLFPWYATDGGIFDPAFASTMAQPAVSTGWAQALLYGHWWLLAPVIGFAGCGAALLIAGQRKTAAVWMVAFSSAGLALTVLQGLLIARQGQPAMGVGAWLSLVGLLFILTTAVSGLGRGRGDAFTCGLIGAIVASIAVFVFYPVAHILLRAFELRGNLGYGFSEILPRLFSSEIWGAKCLILAGPCGPAVNSLILAILTGLGTTFLGLAFALVITRTDFRAKKLLRVLTIIPIITPPFVIGLALILLFGRSGSATAFFAEAFGWERTRWLYGFTGIYIAQLLSFTPIAFLVLIGVVEGVSPSMEEASQTLDASRWQTFRYVSLPLMRPGLANAFLLGFIESLADFGNPLVLGANFDVLSTEIYFSVVGAVADPARAAILSLALLILALSAFLAQRHWVGKKSYTTVSGKADSGRNADLSPGVRLAAYGLALPWALFTVIVYSMILFGSFVKLWGRDHSFTMEHYLRAFAINTSHGLQLTGSAWDSYFTTLSIAGISAPLTAALGLATAYLLVRHRFAGKNAFEFSTMLSFAIPGTVIGVAYVLAFNFPPIELTGTAIILVIVFVFRNMPVGVRGGIAAMSQIDKSLDEASTVLGASSFTTARRILMPLLGPAIMAAITYSFVRSITSVSAVIFLVSANYNMATSFIVGRVENGEFGVAIAYSAVLIMTMLITILGLQLIIGERRLRRSSRPERA